MAADPRIEEILNVLLEYTQKDFSNQIAISKEGDELDAIAVGVNVIGEELGGKLNDLNIAYEDLEAKNEQLNYKNKELEQFAFVAAHDLQEPLRTVSSFVSLLEKKYKGKLDKNADQYLEFISQASIRMSTLIKALLDYSRIGRNQEIEQVDTKLLINNIINDLSLVLEENHAEITHNNLPKVTGYNTELRQLFQNLISNSIRFHSPKKSPKIRISASSEKKYWLFEVSDNGMGIKPEHQEKIFVIFQRLHNRNEIEGTGIGLANCRKIVELHGGKIWVESNGIEGSSFFFTIPR